MALIECIGVRKRFKTGVVAIHNLDLSIDKGEFVFIIGSTGCGKSTLVNMLYRKERPTEGKIYIGGLDVSKLRNNKVYKLRRKIGVVFQDYKLLSRLNVYENVAFTLEVLGLPKEEIHSKVLKVLELVGLKGRAKNYPHELSGGEQQRVSIARAIAKNPKLLLCDEPTGALDYKTGKQVLKTLQDTCKKMGTTVVVITHNSAIAQMADRVIKINDAKVRSMNINSKPLSVEEIEW